LVIFIANCTSDYTFGVVSLFSLLYADDLVLFSDTVEGLQTMLESLKEYTPKLKKM